MDDFILINTVPENQGLGAVVGGVFLAALLISSVIVIYEFSNNEGWAPYAKTILITLSILLIVIPIATTNAFRPTKYYITPKENTYMSDFLEEYEIIGQNGKTLIIERKNND